MKESVITQFYKGCKIPKQQILDLSCNNYVIETKNFTDIFRKTHMIKEVDESKTEDVNSNICL